MAPISSCGNGHNLRQIHRQSYLSAFRSLGIHLSPTIALLLFHREEASPLAQVMASFSGFGDLTLPSQRVSRREAILCWRNNSLNLASERSGSNSGSYLIIRTRPRTPAASLFRTLSNHSNACSFSPRAAYSCVIS